MDYRLELEIWKGVQRSLTKDAFAALLSQAFRTYKRPSGYFPLDRLHAGDVDEAGLEALSIALSSSETPAGIATDGYVSLRAPLRAHLYRVLQRHVIAHFLASDAVVDNRLAGDLGI
ncbi:hypothetical protein AO069_06505 [Pseudomonas syringae pv. syringae PD2774]|uniref:hypothetical protein n=1 Tax=Pseudomonas syringae TaxID=317 RepID=UPI0007375D42|nr:hypothetical protein [Pseudomonas syringae]KTB88289.1 hypothetical protein AO069_06505 [Pseudomonas syringae pv. syringae PD2774]